MERIALGGSIDPKGVEYLKRAVKLERRAARARNSEFKAELLEAAAAYRWLAAVIRPETLN